MGRQIQYIHSEIDTQAFLAIIENYGGRIILNKIDVAPTTVEHEIISKMASYSCRYCVIPSVFISSSQKINCTAIEHGNAIEFRNSTKKNSLSRTYESGRLYISPMTNGEYDKDILALYNHLSSYIKKHYFFSQKSHIYFAPDFMHYYQKHYYFAIHGNTPLVF